LERMKDLMLPQSASTPVGRLLAEDYDRVAKGLLNNGLIKEIPDYTSFYRKCIPNVEK
jgi:hypothetical protein